VLAQSSSLLTPVLAHFPTLLYLLSTGGSTVLALALMWSLLQGLSRHKKLYYGLSLLYLFCLVAVQLNIWARVFQLSLAGLVVGGSLIMIGSIDANYLRKQL
jgi:hypothetical protein